MMQPQITPTWKALDNRLDHWAVLMGRLRSGVDINQRQALPCPFSTRPSGIRIWRHSRPIASVLERFLLRPTLNLLREAKATRTCGKTLISRYAS